MLSRGGNRGCWRDAYVPTGGRSARARKNAIHSTGEAADAGIVYAAERGSAAAELALVLPFLCMLLVGAVEFSHAFALQVDLEQAAQRAVELAVVRAPTANTTAALAHVKSEAETASGQPSANVSVELYRECNGTKQGTYGSNCASGQRQADFVSVEIRGTYARWIDWRSLAGGTSDAPPTLRGQAHARVR